jgi:hypothetical protein
LYERRQLQSQARTIAHRVNRMMMSNDLNSTGQLDRAIAVLRIKTIAPPRFHKIDIGPFDVRCLTVDLPVVIASDEDDPAILS